jgi:hypothetical protein
MCVCPAAQRTPLYHMGEGEGLYHTHPPSPTHPADRGVGNFGDGVRGGGTSAAELLRFIPSQRLRDDLQKMRDGNIAKRMEEW